MSIDLDTYASALGLEPHIRFLRMDSGIRIHYSFAHIETKDSQDAQVLRGAYGSGSTIFEAKMDYAKSIAGKILVQDAYSVKRRQYQAPSNISVVEQKEDVVINARAHAKTQLDDFLHDHRLRVEVKMIDIELGGGVLLNIPSHGILKGTGTVGISGKGPTLDAAREELCSSLEGKTLTPINDGPGSLISVPLSLTPYPESTSPTPTI